MSNSTKKGDVTRRKAIKAIIGAGVVVVVGGGLYYLYGQGTSPSPPSPPATQTTTTEISSNTAAQVADAIRAEGAQLTIAGWEFNGLGQTAFAPAFADYVKQTYGVDANVSWVPFASVGDVIPKLQVLAGANKPLSDAGFDVVTGEYSWYSQYATDGFIEPFVSGSIDQAMIQQLMPRLADVPSQWQAADRVQFQAFAWLQPLINGDKLDASKFHDWKDFADPQFKGNLAVRSMALYSGRLPLIGLIRSLGMDPWDDNSWTTMMKWFRDNIQPNVVTYFSEWGNLYNLMQSGEALASFNGWDSHYRQLKAQGVPLADVLPDSGCPSDPGNLFTIKDSLHPVLSRIWINWMLGPAFQFAGYYRPAPDKPVENLFGLDLPSVLYTCEKTVDLKDSNLLPPALVPYYPTDQQLLDHAIPVNTDYYTLDKQNWIYEQWQKIVGTK
jgi:ABC-type Fe3+ transport system substrate-binding protein